MRRVEILTAVVLMMSVSGCGSADPAPVAAPTVTSPAVSIEPMPSATPVSSAAAEAGVACKLAAGMPKTGEAVDIDEETVKKIIANAEKSGIAGIERAGAQLRVKYDAWSSSAIGDTSATAMDELLDAVGRIRSACEEAAVR